MDTRETVTLDRHAQHRLFVLTQVLEGRVSFADACRLLQRSERQVRRLLAALRADGAAGLVHGNRGRAPVHRTPDGLRARLVELATTTYAGCNRSHLADLLAEREGIVIADRTLRRILAEAGVAPARKRRPRRHRSRRERMGQAGRLVQVDGSRHRWLGPDAPFLTLLAAIDDATGVVTAAVFRAQEDAAGYLELLTRTVAGYGRPLEVYSDRHGIFVVEGRRDPTIEEQLAGERPRTQVGRALAEAGIGWIGARSPQAKGRIERLWRTLQDRLLAELRLAGATTIEAANAVLAAYLPRHNARFAVPAADPASAWRPWDLDRAVESVFCFAYPRRVANDATVSWHGRSLALPERPGRRSFAGCAVVLEERLDGSPWVRHEGASHPVTPAPDGPLVLRARRVSAASTDKPDFVPLQAPGRASAVWRPAPDHPWRRSIRSPER
jgi:transposase